MTSLSHRRVLALNKAWLPICIKSLEDAITALFTTYKNGEPKAKIIDPVGEFRLYTWEDWSKLEVSSEDEIIRTVSKNFKIPEVIMYTRFDRQPRFQVNFSRRSLFKRDNNTCNYCGAQPGTEELTIDHIMPRSRGGKTTWENCCIACLQCNIKKSNRTPEEANMKLRRLPFKPKFSLFKNERTEIPKSWNAFISEAYWSVEIENDM